MIIKIISFFIDFTAETSVSSTSNFQTESGLTELDYQSFIEEISRPKSMKRKPYQRWSNKERFQIGEYASLHGSSTAAKYFGTKEKPLSETTARRFSRLYKKELQQAEIDKRDTKKELAVKTRGRPLLLGSSLDRMVQQCLLELQSQGVHISSTVAVSAAKVIIAKNPQYQLDGIDLDSGCWAQSLFRRMGYTRKLQTTTTTTTTATIDKAESTDNVKVSLSMVHKSNYPVSYTHLTLPTICSV